MKVVRNAIADRLLGLSSITSLVSTFRSVPAIFTTLPIPPSVTGTWISIRDAHVDLPYDTKQPTVPPADYVGTIGREVEHDIGIYSDADGDASDVEDLAVLVRDALHRHPLTVSGYGTLIARANGPFNAPGSEAVEEYVEGRIVTVALTVIRSS